MSRNERARIRRGALFRAAAGLGASALLALAFAGGGWARRPGAADEAPPSSAVVLYVFDGDSFQARFPDGSAGGVRLIGVNSPEMTDGRDDIRCWAFLAKRFAAHHLAGKRVELEYDWEKKDVHGRLLAYVRLPSGGERLFNKLIIRSGFAYAFLKYPFRDDYRKDFQRALQDARREGSGLWRKGPPPEVPASRAGTRLGEHVTLRVRCAEVADGKRYLTVFPDEGGLRILVSKESGLDLGDAASWPGKRLAFSGILEQSPQGIMMHVHFSSQMIR
jgi:micrococcal nuclease